MRYALDMATADTDESRAGSVDATPTVSVSSDAVPKLEPDRVELPVAGRYVLIEKSGTGGMGTVWRAYDPKLRREIALKQLHHKALAGDGAARLVREAQAMAQLSHANVVAVYDVELGEDDSASEPANVLIAMEYVAGSDLRTWLKEQAAPSATIIELYRQAGRGLAAAHAVGMVHRDFKPANVLIAGDAGRGWVAKVTDFGLAKGVTAGDSHAFETVSGADLERSGSDHGSAPLTDHDTIVGTPRYMAPEQHKGEVAGPATDQYAFCVALWEALAGSPPFSGNELYRAKMAGPPKWPERSSVPTRVVAAISQGMLPDPADRWPSMDALLERLVPQRGAGRHLGYAALLIGGAGAIAAWGSTEVDPCTGATAALGEVWNADAAARVTDAFTRSQLPYADTTAQNVVARLDAYASAWVEQHKDACMATTVRNEQSDAALDLRMACLHRARGELSAVGDQLREAEPGAVEHAVLLAEGLPKLSQCADLAALQQDVAPPDDPAVAARVEEAREQLARISAQRRTGDYTNALEQAKAVIEVARALGYEPLIAEAELELGAALIQLSELDPAEAAFRTALEIALRDEMHGVGARASTSLLTLVGYTRSRHDEAKWLVPLSLSLSESADPQGTLEARAHHALAMLHDSKAEYEDAHREMMAARALHVLASGERSLAVALEDQHLGQNAVKRGKYEESEALLRRGTERNAELLGEDHPSVAKGLNVLGDTLRWKGRNDEAKEVMLRALEIQRRVYPAGHPTIGATLSNLGIVDYIVGDYEGAVEYNLQALQMRRKNGDVSKQVADSYNNLGACYSALGRHGDALVQHGHAMRIRSELFEEDHPAIAMSLSNMAIAARNQKRFDEAADYAKRALDLSIVRLGPTHGDVANMYETYGNVLQDQGDLEGAMAQYDEALEIRETSLGEGHAEVARSLVNRGNVLEKQGRFEAAQKGFRRAIEIWEREVGPEYTDLAHAYVGLGNVLEKQGRRADAIVALERALEIRTPGLGADHPLTIELEGALVDLRKG